MTTSSGESLDTIASDVGIHMRHRAWRLTDDLGVVDGTDTIAVSLATFGSWLERVFSDDDATDLIAARLREHFAPRTVTTAEELDALADGSVVIDSDGEAYAKYRGDWYRSVGDAIPCPTTFLTRYAPLTVLHEPVVTP